MFENFVVFTEVIKLSSIMFWKMKEVNYHDELLDLIYDREDVITFEEVIDVVDKYLITRFIYRIDPRSNPKKWIENILKAISYIDITAFNNKLLFDSSCHGFYDFVKLLIERPDCKICDKQCIHGANIHAQDDYALRLAAVNNHLEVVKYLIGKGANIHAKNDDILVWTSQYNHLEIIKYLVERSDCNVCNEKFIHGIDIKHRGGDALKWAARYNCLEVVKYLLEKGGDIHAWNGLPLIYAAANGHLEVVKFLIERPDCKVCKQQCIHGANIRARNNRALKRAAERGQLEIVKYLVEKLDCEIFCEGCSKKEDVCNENNDCLLEYARYSKDPQVINYIKMKITNQH